MGFPNRSFVVVAIVYIVLRPATIVLKYDIFIDREPEIVFKKLVDAEAMIQDHPYAEYTKLIERRKNEDGFDEEVYEYKENVPVFGDWTIPVKMNITLTYTKPGKEVIHYFYIWYAMLDGNMLRGVKPELTDGKTGSRVYEEFTLHTPWITKMFVESRANTAHKDSLNHMKKDLEETNL